MLNHPDFIDVTDGNVSLCDADLAHAILKLWGMSSKILRRRSSSRPFSPARQVRDGHRHGEYHLIQILVSVLQ